MNIRLSNISKEAADGIAAIVHVQHNSLLIFDQATTAGIIKAAQQYKMYLHFRD